MSSKPLIPTDAEIEVVDRVWSGLSGLDAEVAGLVPVKVQESLKILSDMGTVLDAIRTEQPKRLESYAEVLMAVLRDSGLTEDQAFDAISGLFSSVAVARLLGDVAAGNLDPVAAVRKTKPTAPKKTAAKKAAPAAVVALVVEAPAEPVATPEPEPVATPEPETDEAVVPDDFDLPIVEKPAAKKAAAKRPAAVPVPTAVPTSIGAGLVDADVDETDF